MIDILVLNAEAGVLGVRENVKLGKMVIVKHDDFRAITRDEKGQYKLQGLPDYALFEALGKDFSKEKTFELIIKKEGLDKDRIIYLGNELKKGNDEAILNTGVKTIETEDVFEAYMFLKVFFGN